MWYATKYWVRQWQGKIRVIYVLCTHCANWVPIKKIQQDQAHQCMCCQKVFIETPNPKKRDVYVDDLKGG
jgi:uncharacterized paraquat-inducible protein A